ncbi:hypothetical protein FACS189483_11170 [Spirochaetia bacterium]|nr:hypothetical protein FACS189483_11170 [Spirochaetia bacterium]
MDGGANCKDFWFFISHNVKAIQCFCGCDKGNLERFAFLGFPATATDFSPQCAGEKTHKGRSPTAFADRRSDVGQAATAASDRGPTVRMVCAYSVCYAKYDFYFTIYFYNN